MQRKRIFRRKRRIRGSQGTWFPIAGNSWTDGESGTWYDAGISDAIPIGESRDFGSFLSVHPVTQDYTARPQASGGESVDVRPSLRDYTEGQDYLLKRLVGNVQFFAKPPTNKPASYDPTVSWWHIQCAAGFFVARAQDADQSLPDLTTDEIDPLGGVNIQNSWIWRRTWILDNPYNLTTQNVAGDETVQFDNFSNRLWGDDAGPHFDTKSRRRIKREERLWFVAAAIGWDGTRGSVSGNTFDQPVGVFNLDVRLFGKMVRGKTSSTF